MDDHSDHLDRLRGMIDPDQRAWDESLFLLPEDVEAVRWALAEISRMEADRERVSLLCSVDNDDICQTLGKALGYPWFKDDQENFPGATEVDGVCVGEHVGASIAAEAADRIVKLEGEVDRLRRERNAFIVVSLRFANSGKSEAIESSLATPMKRTALVRGVFENLIEDGLEGYLELPSDLSED